MRTDGKRGASSLATTKKRNIKSFEPCGPVNLMLEAELKHLGQKGRGRKATSGALKRILSLCVVQSLGPKYPKLLERYHLLEQEGVL